MEQYRIIIKCSKHDNPYIDNIHEANSIIECVYIVLNYFIKHLFVGFEFPDEIHIKKER